MRYLVSHVELWIQTPGFRAIAFEVSVYADQYFLCQIFGFGDVTGFNLKSFAIAIAGSLLVLWAYRKIKSS